MPSVFVIDGDRDLIMFQRFSKYAEKAFYIFFVYGAQRAQTECIRTVDLPGVDSESARITVVMYFFKVPAGVVGINDGHYKP